MVGIRNQVLAYNIDLVFLWLKIIDENKHSERYAREVQYENNQEKFRNAIVERDTFPINSQLKEVSTGRVFVVVEHVPKRGGSISSYTSYCMRIESLFGNESLAVEKIDERTAWSFFYTVSDDQKLTDRKFVSLLTY
jgi:hypothetical protein